MTTATIKQPSLHPLIQCLLLQDGKRNVAMEMRRAVSGACHRLTQSVVKGAPLAIRFLTSSS